MFTPASVATLTSIAVTPANPTVTVGGTQQFTATGTYSDSSTLDLTNQVTFASSTPGVATVTAGGLATAVATGMTTISATLGSVSGSTGLTVAAGPLTITTTSLPTGSVNLVYTATLAASGGTPPYTWAIASGTLPTGLTLTPSTGAIAGTPTARGTSNFTVQVTAGAQNVTKALSITVNAAVMIWPSNPTPAIVDGGDPGAVELGVKFRSDVAGSITGIRFYKSAANTGTHVGNLWSSAGAKLGTVTFTGETASGWQQMNFATPVAIQANTVYVASYFAPNGHYSATLDYFATQGVDTPPLHALSSGVSGVNGVYAYGAASSFPTSMFRTQSYWVDVMFMPAVVPTLTSIAVTPANPTMTVGGTQQLTATGTYSDASTQNLTSQVTWSSSNTGAATVTAGGLATAVAPGTATISATLGSVSGSTGVTVNAGAVTIWPSNPTPAIVDGGDPGAVELGIKFRSDVAGSITGIRFYKSAANTGPHIGNLWSLGGVNLGTVTFTGETASGWQQMNFPTPVPIQANTVYVASYFVPNGHYSANLDYLATQGVDNPPLHALADGVSGGNGVFNYGAASSFPTSTYRSQTYWVDVVFGPS
jgi:uncharacterized protein YjdB